MHVLFYILLVALSPHARAEVQADVEADGIQLVPDEPAKPIPPQRMKKEIEKEIRKAKPVRRKPLPKATPPPTPTPTATPVPTSTPSPTPTPTPEPTPRPVVTKPVPAPVEKVVVPVVRTPAVAPVPENVQTKSKLKEDTRSGLVTLGVNAGADYGFPSLTLDFALSSSLSLGFNLIASSNFHPTEKTTTLGALLIASYFPSEMFRGFHVRTGVGGYYLNGTTPTGSATSTPFAAMGTLNWRFLSPNGNWNFGLGAGLQYAFGPAVPGIQFSGALPLFTIDLGYAF